MSEPGKRIYTIYNQRLHERVFIEAQDYREAFKKTGWDPMDKCLILPFKDRTTSAMYERVGIRLTGRTT